MAYIGTEPKDVRSFGRAKFDYTATQGQTAFTGADDDGKTLGFTDGQMEVFVNGILMDESDFSTSNGNTVTLASAANLNDIISIVAMQTDIPNSDYVPASGGTFTGAVTASNGLTVDDDGATPLTVDRASSFGTIIDVQKDGSSVGAVGSPYGGELYIQGTGANSSGLLFTSGNTIQPRKNSAADDGNIDIGTSGNKFKDLYLGGGVYLGGTGAVNKLDDYEHGTFSPTYTTSAGDASGVTYTPYNKGVYVKIGNVVHFQFQLSINAMTSAGTGSPRFGGLPFNTSSSAPLNEATRYPVSTYVVDYVTSSTAGYIIQAYFPTSGVNYLQILLTQDAYAWAVLNTSQFTVSAGDYVSIMGTYFAD